MATAIDVRPLIGNNMSGVEIYTKELLFKLFQQNPKETFILYCNAAKHQEHLFRIFKHQNVKIVHTHIPNKILNIAFCLLRWPKIDKIIYKRTGITPKTFFCPDLRPAPLSKECEKVMTVHDLSFEHFPKYFSLKSRLWYKLLNPKKEFQESQKIIAVSEFTKSDLVRTYNINPQKITTIYEGIDENFKSQTQKIQQIKEKYKLPQSFFLFLATIEPRKNIKNLLTAFAHFKQTDQSDTKLILAGKTNPKIFATVNKRPTTDIQFIGFVNEEDKATLYSQARAFIYPSLHEGFGLPLLEAMKVGTPIITSKRSSMPEVVADAALLINPESPKEIATAMNKVLESNTRQKLKQKMIGQIKKFSWEQTARKTAKLLSLCE